MAVPRDTSSERRASAAKLGATDRIHRAYAPLPRRRRLLIALLALAAAISVVTLLSDPPGRAPHPRAPLAADVPACAPGQADGCVGSVMQVLPSTQRAASAVAPASANR